MANYETIIIIRQDVSTNQVDSLIDELAKMITDAKGEISRREYWGLRSIAYRIRKNRKGHYCLLNYSVDSAIRDEMERIMRLNSDVLRYMSIATEELPSEASAIMKERTQDTRPERGNYNRN